MVEKNRLSKESEKNPGSLNREEDSNGGVVKTDGNNGESMTHSCASKVDQDAQKKTSQERLKEEFDALVQRHAKTLLELVDK